LITRRAAIGELEILLELIMDYLTVVCGITISALRGELVVNIVTYVVE
jgi:hypothetical protein